MKALDNLIMNFEMFPNFFLLMNKSHSALFIDTIFVNTEALTFDDVSLSGQPFHVWQLRRQEIGPNGCGSIRGV